MFITQGFLGVHYSGTLILAQPNKLALTMYQKLVLKFIGLNPFILLQPIFIQPQNRTFTLKVKIEFFHKTTKLNFLLKSKNWIFMLKQKKLIFPPKWKLSILTKTQNRVFSSKQTKKIIKDYKYIYKNYKILKNHLNASKSIYNCINVYLTFLIINTEIIYMTFGNYYKLIQFWWDFRFYLFLSILK